MPKILSAGVIPLRRTADGWRMLVLRAYKNWDFPKGVVEPDEDPLDAAKREALEETDLSDLHFTFGDTYRETCLMPAAKWPATTLPRRATRTCGCRSLMLSGGRSTTNGAG